MDPLSIAGTTLAFIQVADKIKDSINKVGHNRKRLQQLASDVARGIADIQRFCETHRQTHETVGAVDLREALDDLSQDLRHVLRRCEKLASSHAGPSTPLKRIGASINAWINRNDIETDLMRLKEQVQSWHIRFLTFSVARMEQNALVHRLEDRARSTQMDGLVSSMLLQNHASGLPSPPALDFAVYGDVLYLYLQQHLNKIIAGTERLDSMRRDWYEKPDQQHSIMLSFDVSSPPQSRTTLFKEVLFDVLSALRQLETDPSAVSIQTVAFSLYFLAKALKSIALPFDAATLACAASKLYGRLVEGNQTQEFLYYHACALNRVASYLSCQNFDEGYVASEGAVTLWTQLYDADGGHRFAIHVAHALLNYSLDHRHLDQYDSALEYSKQSLEVIRQIPYTYEGYHIVKWDVTGDEAAVIFASRGEYSRPAHVADSEAYALLRVAQNLVRLSYYAEAWIVGMEAVNCFRALLHTFPMSVCSETWEKRLEFLGEELPSWVSFVRHPAQILPKTDRQQRKKRRSIAGKHAGSPLAVTCR